MHLLQSELKNSIQYKSTKKHDNDSNYIIVLFKFVKKEYGNHQDANYEINNNI